MNSLESLFNPKSIAIVGISQDKSKISNVIFQNIKDISYKGLIYLINPKYTEIENTKCYSSLKEISQDIDTVCVAIPKEFVINVVKECVDLKVKNIIIITAGFKEVGEEGKKLEDELKILIEGTNTRILGPNCLGLISTISNTNISFASGSPIKGNISLFSQSGALCTAILDRAKSDKLGFSHFVSTGNEVDLNELDFLNYFLNDEKTKVICAYLEGISKKLELLNIYSNAVINKPFITLMPGRSKQSQTAMLSHTGSIANDNNIYETAVKKYSIIPVKSLSEMYELSKAFSWGKEVKGNRVAILTNAGGPGIIATDCVMESGLTLSTISENSKGKLQSFLPNFASLRNPIDILGDAKSDRYEQTLKILVQDENIDVIFVLLTPQYVTEIDKTTEVLIEISKTTLKPIIPIYLGEQSIQNSIEKFNNSKMLSYIDIDKAVSVIYEMYKYNLNISIPKPQLNFDTIRAETGKYSQEIRNVCTNTSKAVPEGLVDKIVHEVGIVIPPQKICSTIEEACDFASSIYPVVIKAPNSVIAHKTDIKAVYTNIKNDTELKININLLKDSIKNNLGIELNSFLIQKQMKFKEEIILGVKRDGNSDVYKTYKGFGHILLFGKGGIYSEVYKDFAFDHLPTDFDNISKLMANTKIANILVGYRGEQPLAVRKLALTILKIQKLVFLYPEIDSLDINPLFLDSENVYAVDIKINVSL